MSCVAAHPHHHGAKLLQREEPRSVGGEASRWQQGFPGQEVPEGPHLVLGGGDACASQRW